jgi:hypothetical protein
LCKELEETVCVTWTVARETYNITFVASDMSTRSDSWLCVSRWTEYKYSKSMDLHWHNGNEVASRLNYVAHMSDCVYQ